ncbi:MAG: hypothetical protein WA979_11145 [Pacificimonas sp.]
MARTLLPDVMKASLLTAVALSLSALSGTAAAQERADPAAQSRAALPDVDEDDYLLLSVEKGSYLLGDSVEAYRLHNGSYCLDLKQMMTALDFPITVDVNTASASGWFLNERNRFVLEPDNVTYGRNNENIEGSELYRHSGGLCAEADALARWFSLTMTPRFGESRLRLTTSEKLPVELAADRERMRARLGQRRDDDDLLQTLPDATAPYALWRTPSVDLVASLGANQSGREPHVRGIARYALFAAGEAARLSYDARLSSDRDAIPQSLRLRAYRQDAEGRLFGGLGATEAVIGDVRTTSNGLISTSAAGRGVWLTNLPLTRASDFDVTALYGELPVGWEAELYRNGALVAFAEPGETGRYIFEEIPLLYGENRFEVVLYGPQGQERRETFIRRVGEEAVPAGKTWYRAGAVEDGRDLLTLSRENIGRTPLQAVIGAEHGVSKTFSLGLAAHAVEDEDGRMRGYLEASATTSFGGGVLEVDAVRGVSGGTAIGARLTGGIGKTSYFLSGTMQDDIRTDDISEGTRGFYEARLIHDASSESLPLVGSLNARYRDNRRGRDVSDVTATITSRLAGLSVAQGIGWEKGTRARTADGAVVARTQIGGRAGKLSLRGEARYRLSNGAGLDEARLTATYRVDQRGTLRGEARYDHDRRLGAFTAGYAQRFDRFALGAEVEADTQGSVAAGVNLAMSFGPGPTGRFANVSSDKLAARGQARARVFTDLNGDSLWQEDEPVHEGVRIAADRRITRAQTDDHGAALVAGLSSGKKTILKIDAASLEDPLLLPASDGVVIVPRRGVAMPVDLPLTPTGEVEGMLYDGRQPVAGALLELIGPDGKVAAEAKTDFDGFILFEMVRYGRYTLRFAADTAAVVGHDQPLATGIVVSDKQAVANLGAVRFTPSGAPRLTGTDPPGTELQSGSDAAAH